MGVPHVTSFCWCMGLEVGAKCVGFVHLLVSFALMILGSVYAEGFRSLAGTPDDVPDDGVFSAWYKISVTVALLSVGHVLLALTLLISVIKRSTCGIRLWVYVMCTLLLAALACIAVLVGLHGLAGRGADIFVAFLEGVLFFGVMAYCILGVNSYYLMLRSSEDMEGPHKSTY